MPVEIFSEGPAPVIMEVCRQIGLTKTIDQMTYWDEHRCTLSPGLRTAAMVTNALMDRMPLMYLPQFFADMDTQKLFGEGIQPEDLNDHSMGRALDKLSEAGPERVYARIAMRAMVQEQIQVDTIHADTTSMSVQGAYEADDEGLNLTHGYSKDGRPDLKQFLYGLGVTPDGVPVVAQVRDGNTADPTWNGDIVDMLRERVGTQDRETPLLYVADSKLVSKTNLDKLAEENLHFISRLPGTFNLDEELKARAWEQDQWCELGSTSEKKGAAEYRAQSFYEELYGRTYRFIVLHSSNLDGRRERGINNQLDRSQKRLEEELDDLQKRSFACEADAREVWEDFCSKHDHPCFGLQAEVESFEHRLKRDKPGRPPKDWEPEYETRWRIRPQLSRDAEAIYQRKSRASCFVLITNLTDEDEWTDRKVLVEYKNQSTVESQFRFLKKPKVTGPIYLKNPGRVNALAYVFLMALLVYSVIQRRVRRALKQEGETILIVGKKTTSRPTGKKILDRFSHLGIVRDEHGNREFPTNLKVPRKVMRLMGVKPEVYLRGPPD